MIASNAVLRLVGKAACDACGGYDILPHGKWFQWCVRGPEKLELDWRSERAP